MPDPSNSRKFYEHQTALGEIERVYCCPCCGYPTVGEPPSWEICPICSWEDDDVTYEDPNITGANGDYSLDEAKRNFKQYLTMYRKDHEGAPQLKRSGYTYVHEFELRPDNLARKRRLMAWLERYMAEPDLRQRGEIWDERRQHP